MNVVSGWVGYGATDRTNLSFGSECSSIADRGDWLSLSFICESSAEEKEYFRFTDIDIGSLLFKILHNGKMDTAAVKKIEQSYLCKIATSEKELCS